MNLTHHFLLSMPSLGNSWFEKSLSYIFEHDGEGAMGFVVNRPAPLTAGEIYDQLDISCTDTQCRRAPVYTGGPMDQERGFVLYKSEQYDLPTDSSIASNGGRGIGLSGSTEFLAAIAAGKGPTDYLLLLGYAGWGADQLEGEIADNAWLTCEAQTDILFSDNLDSKLNRAARSIGIDYSMLSSDAGHA